MTSAEVRHLKPIKNNRRGAQSPLSFFPALNFVKLRHENTRARPTRHFRGHFTWEIGAFYLGVRGILLGKRGILLGKRFSKSLVVQGFSALSKRFIDILIDILIDIKRCSRPCLTGGGLRGIIGCDPIKEIFEAAKSQTFANFHRSTVRLFRIVYNDVVRQRSTI